MKVLLPLISIICILTFGSCEKWSETTVKTVYLEGEEIKGLSLQLHPNTVINYSEETSITVEINETLLDKLKVTKNENGIVSISVDNFSMPSTGKFIYNVTANINRLDFIESIDGADIVVNGKFKGEETRILLNGGATIKGLNLELSNKYTVDMWNASRLEDTISCPNIKMGIQMQSSVKSHIINCDNTTYSLSGRSTIILKSDIDQVAFNSIAINALDDSTLEADSVQFKTVNATLYKSVSKIFATESLTCNLSYKSKLYYRGTPTITQTVSADSELIDDNKNE